MAWATSSGSGVRTDSPRGRIWSADPDPGLVAELAPFVRTIREDGAPWRWEMTGLKVLGVGVAPAFTEKMTYDEPERIEFRHDPPTGATERSSVEGWYSLAEHPAGTRLVTALEITLPLPLDLPLPLPQPRVSGPAVGAAMNRVIDQLGERFSRNLLAHLRAPQVG